MTSDEAGEAIKMVAGRFASGSADIFEMWAALSTNTYDLCAEAPLQGNYLDLFNALESWEIAVGPAREDAVETARCVAERLAAEI